MRLSKIDALRGLTLISMIAYHTAWDLVFIYGINIPGYRETPGFLWQQSICWTFILLSGFSWALGRHHLKRGIIVFLSGALITLVTLLFMPEDIVIFGILTFMGSAMLIMIPLDRLLKKIRGPFIPAVLFISLLFFFITKNIMSGYVLGKALPPALFSGYISTFFGFPFPGFFSTDYFPIIPWFFLYITGYTLNRLLPVEKRSFLSGSFCPPLEFIGRHTLIIYLLHQPVIMAVSMLIFRSRAF